jgi:hypothetical protein
MMGSLIADGGELLRLRLRGCVSGRLVRLGLWLSTIPDLPLLPVALGGFRSDFSLACQVVGQGGVCFALVSHGDSRPAT